MKKDPYGSAQVEGRRQVWLLIVGYLNLTDSEIEAAIRNGAQQEQEV